MKKAVQILISIILGISFLQLGFQSLPVNASPIVAQSDSQGIRPALSLVPLIADPHSTGLGVPARFPEGRLSPQAASFVIDYIPAGSTNRFGDTCQTWPVEAQAAFQAATGVWASLLTSAVPIRIEACWADLGSTSILGGSATLWQVRDQATLPRTATYYPVALANALAGTDQVTPDYCASRGYAATWCDDMSIVYNSGFAPNFYYGTGGFTPAGKYDFMSIVLHEIGHGLGFAGSMCVKAARGDWGGSSSSGCAHDAYPDSYDHYAYGSAGALLNTSLYPRNSAALAAALTSNVSFGGENARAAYGGSNAPLYTPATWSAGSSYSHLGEVFNTYNSGQNALMTYSIGTAEWFHDPGPVGRGVLQDVGWAPFAPAAFSAAATSDTQIALSWSDTNRNESGYRIERSLDGVSGWQVVQTTPADATSWSDSGLTPATPYFYRLRAFHAVGESLAVTASATTLDPTAVMVTEFSAGRVSPTSLQLSWSTATEVGLVGFNLYRKPGPGGEEGFTRLNAELIPAQKPGMLAGSQYGFGDALVLPGVTYTYELEGIRQDPDYPVRMRLSFQDFAFYLPEVLRP